MTKEKIYFEDKGVSVSSSRVILHDLLGKKTNIVLRNISSVKVNSVNDGNGIVGIGCGGFIVLAGFGTIVSEDNPILGLMMLVCGGLMMYYLRNKMTYYVGVNAGGGEKFLNYMPSKDEEKPNQVVQAINEAILDLDKNNSKSQGSTSNSENSSLDEIKKLKELLDSGIITQEEFDLKKKDLLGL